MAHGQPDFGMYTLAKTIYRMTDMGELAARLGSICTFDRRGDVIWLDDFEGPATSWALTPDGVGSLVHLSSDAFRSGSQSMLIRAGAAVDDCSIIANYFPFFVPSKLGLEISFTNDGANMGFLFNGYMYDGTKHYYFAIKYDGDTKVLSIYDKTEGWVPLGAKNLRVGSFMFHTMKVVVDFEILDYVRLLLNEAVYDISDYVMFSDDDDTLPSLYVSCGVTNKTLAANPTSYVDDFILTQNEP